MGEDIFVKAERFVEMLEKWLFEIRMRCEETRSPEECHETARQLDEKIEKFKEIMKIRRYLV